MNANAATLHLAAEASETTENTRERLLVAAREVFSAHGFKGATVREICSRAGVNVAAVNYHFKGKEALFSAALNLEPINTLICSSDSVTCSKARLTQFLQEFMAKLMNETGTPQSQLMMHELIEPTLALDSIVKDVVAPLHEFIGQLVRNIVGEDVAHQDIRRCVFSIIGQCAFYRHSSEVIRRLHPSLRYDQNEIAATAKHIAEFSLAGLQRITQEHQTLGMNHSADQHHPSMSGEAK